LISDNHDSTIISNLKCNYNLEITPLIPLVRGKIRKPSLDKGWVGQGFDYCKTALAKGAVRFSPEGPR